MVATGGMRSLRHAQVGQDEWVLTDDNPPSMTPSATNKFVFFHEAMLLLPPSSGSTCLHGKHDGKECVERGTEGTGPMVSLLTDVYAWEFVRLKHDGEPYIRGGGLAMPGEANRHQLPCRW